MFTAGDQIGILASFSLVFAVIGVAEALRKLFKLPSSFTRKVVHIGVGNWIFIWPLTFANWYAILIPPLVLVARNYVSYRRQVFKAMERKGETGGLGTVYYAISNAILAPTFQFLRAPWVAATGVMLMAWADGFADIVGRRYGSHKYSLMGSTKSVEGSLGFFIIGIVASVLTLFFFSPYGGPSAAAVVAMSSLVACATATVVEALSPQGTDNITVPVLASLVLFFYST